MAIKVSELINQLQKLPQDMSVAMVFDEEENIYYDEMEVEEDRGVAVIYATAREVELEEIEGFEPNEEDLELDTDPEDYLS